MLANTCPIWRASMEFGRSSDCCAVAKSASKDLPGGLVCCTAFIKVPSRSITSEQNSVCQRGQAGAQAGLIRGIDLGNHDAGAARQAVQHTSPRVDDHAVAVGR